MLSLPTLIISNKEVQIKEQIFRVLNNTNFQHHDVG